MKLFRNEISNLGTIILLTKAEVSFQKNEDEKSPPASAQEY